MAKPTPVLAGRIKARPMYRLACAHTFSSRFIAWMDCSALLGYPVRRRDGTDSRLDLALRLLRHLLAAGAGYRRPAGSVRDAAYLRGLSHLSRQAPSGTHLLRRS